MILTTESFHLIPFTYKQMAPKCMAVGYLVGYGTHFLIVLFLFFIFYILILIFKEI